MPQAGKAGGGRATMICYRECTSYSGNHAVKNIRWCPTAQPVETASGLRARRRILADESDAAWYLVATGLQGGYTVGTLPFTFRNGVTNERGHARPLGHRARRAARRG